MKRNKILAWMAAAMTLAACSTNDIADITANDADNVVNIASVTRSGETGNTTAQQMTAPFHLVNVTQKTKFDRKYEADYTYDTSSNKYATTSGNEVLWCKGNDENDPSKMIENVFQAFSPLHTSANNASFTNFTIPTDQSTPDKLAAADWMTATTTLTKLKADNSVNSLDLNFEHRNAKLHFNVTLNDDANGITANDITVIGGIKPYYNSGENTIEAIVEPVSDLSTTTGKLIQIKISDDETLAASFPSTLTSLSPGKQYNFSLSIGHNKATISSVSVADWENSDIDLGGKDDALSYRVETDENGVRTYIVSDFSGFMAWVDNGNGANIKLEKDISVPDETSFPYMSEINGIIDGQGHTIKNIKTLEEGKHSIFNTNKGIIKNVNFEIEISSYSSFLGIVTKNEGTIENCTISGSATIQQDNYRHFSGVCNHNIQSGKIIACVNNVTVNQPEGDINGTITSGGICYDNGGLIFGCINNSNISLVSANNTQYCVIAGIAAKSYLDERTKTPGKIIACANTGTITGNCPIFYEFYEVSTIDYCYWTQGSESTTNMTNSGKVTSWDDTTINALNTAQDGDNKSIQDYGYKFETDANGKLIIVPISSSSAAARR